MIHQNKSLNVYKLTYLAIVTALVILLQLLSPLIRFGTFSITLALLPIIIGVAVGGPMAGAWLGLVFGAAVLLSGDAAFFMGMNPIGTVITVLAKGIVCGIVAGLAYMMLKNVNKYVAVITAAILCPIANTAVFVLGCRLFFMDYVTTSAGESGVSAWGFIFLFLVGGNFFFELLYNVLLAPVITRLLRFLPKSYRAN